MSYSPWGHKESETTERELMNSPFLSSPSHTHIQTHTDTHTCTLHVWSSTQRTYTLSEVWQVNFAVEAGTRHAFGQLLSWSLESVAPTT